MSKFFGRRLNSGSSGGGSSGNTYIDFTSEDGVKNGNVVVSYDNGAPVLDFLQLSSGFGRIQYNISIPSNLQDGYGINTILYWSGTDNASGNVHWQVGYTALKSGISLINAPLTTIDYIQVNDGNKLLNNTGAIFSLSGIAGNDILLLNILRIADINDTYLNTARLSLVRFSYNIQ